MFSIAARSHHDDTNRQQIDPIPFGSIGPDLSDDVLKGAKTWEPKFLRLADETASELDSFICGANQPDLHRFNTSWTAIEQKPTSLDLRNARAGDVCQHNPKSRLTEKRGIEVGHIFQLGRKYSEAMESRFTNENGKTEPFWMGCYGIGVSRLAQAAVEQHHDDSGICWPTAIAPFEAIVVVANIQDDTQAQLGRSALCGASSC